MNGGDFIKAGEAGTGAGNHGADDDELADRKPLSKSRAGIAAGDAGREAEGGACHQDMQHHGEDQPARQPPMHLVSGMAPMR